jgi:tryptophan-rich sensory protein
MSWAKVRALLLSILLCEAAGIAGAVFTISSIPNWYNQLKRPFFAPPNWVFALVWNVLFLLMGISFFLIWVKRVQTSRQEWMKAIVSFLTQLGLNVLWSVIFFGLRLPAIALIEILILLAAILLTVVNFFKISKPAGYLLLPYLAWVSFAILLNAALVWAN